MGVDRRSYTEVFAIVIVARSENSCGLVIISTKWPKKSEEKSDPRWMKAVGWMCFLLYSQDWHRIWNWFAPMERGETIFLQSWPEHRRKREEKEQREDSRRDPCGRWSGQRERNEKVQARSLGGRRLSHRTSYEGREKWPVSKITTDSGWEDSNFSAGIEPEESKCRCH